MPLPTTKVPGDPICAYCHHFHYEEEFPEEGVEVNPYGHCWRYPPSVQALLTMSSSGDVVEAKTLYIRPRLHHEEGCGEFKQALPKLATKG
jgi:hypothetical protein